MAIWVAAGERESTRPSAPRLAEYFRLSGVIPLRLRGPAKMCKLYSHTRSQDAIRELTRATVDSTSGLPPMPAIFPDNPAPVVRNSTCGRELLLMRWGIPGPTQLGALPIPNVRHVQNIYWRAWLKPEYRCLVPFTSFCEGEDATPRMTPTWFALSADRPLAFFAGIWCPWTGTRGPGATAIEGEHLVFTFLTTDPNADVAPLHPSEMPVILTTREQRDIWLSAAADEALRLQRPLPKGMLRIVARGDRKDERPAA